MVGYPHIPILGIMVTLLKQLMLLVMELILYVIYDKNGCVYSVDFEVTNIPTNIIEENNENKVIKVINVLGQEIFDRKKEITFYIYDNGKVERNLFLTRDFNC